MKVKLNPNSRGIIKTAHGEYHRALEGTHIFFVNYDDELDDSLQVKMFDRKRNLVSENRDALVALCEVLDTGAYSWISDRMKKNLVE